MPVVYVDQSGDELKNALVPADQVSTTEYKGAPAVGAAVPNTNGGVIPDVVVSGTPVFNENTNR